MQRWLLRWLGVQLGLGRLQRGIAENLRVVQLLLPEETVWQVLLLDLRVGHEEVGRRPPRHDLVVCDLVASFRQTFILVHLRVPKVRIAKRLLVVLQELHLLFLLLLRLCNVRRVKCLSFRWVKSLLLTPSGHQHLVFGFCDPSMCLELERWLLSGSTVLLRVEQVRAL